MDDLVDSMKSLDGHCPYDEYVNLIGYIQKCETATHATAKKIAEDIREPIKLYTEKVDLTPENFLFTAEYKHIFNIRNLLDRYWDTLRDHPHNYTEQISCALAFFRSVRDYVT